MPTMSPSRLTVFEGPDGAGKTTLAQAWAAETGAKYVHLGPSPGTRGPELAFEYVRAMLPALRGQQHVVLDRCWLSERPYGDAFRGGADRLGDAVRAELEALALECARPVMVLCVPQWETVKANFLARRASEMLQDTEQLYKVWSAYAEMVGRRGLATLEEERSLVSAKVGVAGLVPTVFHDYEARDQDALFRGLL